MLNLLCPDTCRASLASCLPFKGVGKRHLTLEYVLRLTPHC